MPFWSKDPEEEARDQAEDQARAAAEQEAAAARAALEQGGIPPRAARRLDELRLGGEGFFTSDLSVSEFARVRELGMRPLSQVMGSCVYHVGFNDRPTTFVSSGFMSNRQASAQELPVSTGAWNEARQRALSRLWQEARQCGAHAVVGVQVTRRRWDWAAHAIEFVTIGTAVSIVGAPPTDNPALTGLNAQDYWKLHQAGYEPCALVGASTVWWITPSAQTMRLDSTFLGGGYRNQEIAEFAGGVYQARAAALGRLHQHASSFDGSAGVVGVTLDREMEPYLVGDNNDELAGLRVAMHVLGTVVRGPVAGSHLTTERVLDLARD
jgi:uncharacterized protein YbjQ (UPF0145 family)